MTQHPHKTRVYKDSSAQQLRSFCETARLGSISAAAEFLGLAIPTVWQQVRALEREFGETLLERHGRGSRLTEAGKLLADLTRPLVTGLATVKQRYLESRAAQVKRLTVATTPRILLDHLPECVIEFRRQHVDTPLTLREMFDERVHDQVEAGEAELGLVQSRCRSMTGLAPVSPWLEFEPLYHVDVVLITPKDHPLARKRRVLPHDLTRYPLVNVPHSIMEPEAIAVLEEALINQSVPQLVEAFFVSTIIRYVELGFGIALVPMVSGRPRSATLHERVMSDHFGRPTIYQLRRKGSLVSAAAAAFTGVVKARLGRVTAK